MLTTIVLFFLLILLSAFFSGLEIAFFSLSPGIVRSMVQKKRKGAEMVERLKKNPQRLLVTILLGNNLVNIFAAAVATEFALQVFGSAGVGIATGIVTLLVLVFGEIFPKAFAQANAKKIARLTAPLIYILEIILFPIVIILELLTRLFVGERKKALVSEEEIHSMFHLGHEEGTLEKHELEFVERLFKFNDVKIADVMTPIEKVVMLDSEAIVEKVAFSAANSGYSRFPVYKDSQNNIIGLVHIKDIVKANNSDQRDQPLIGITHAIDSVSIAEEVDEVFKKMKQEKDHFLLVVDEKKLVGIITLEDLLEELVGEIYDESDVRKTSVVS